MIAINDAKERLPNLVLSLKHVSSNASSTFERSFIEAFENFHRCCQTVVSFMSNSLLVKVE